MINTIRRELKQLSKKEVAESEKRWFKEEIKTYGIKTPVVRKLANKYFKEIKNLKKKEIFELCEELFKSGYNQEAIIAIQWLGKIKKQFVLSDFKVFEKWLDSYIDNWGKDDDFCLHVIHPMINKYPELVSKTKSWTKSENMWMRRAAAVCFITSIKGFYVTNYNLADIFEVADFLLLDSEDLVQKGYGWMLKAASVHNMKEVFDYVMKNKYKMPRTALRYAIEKMPDDLRKKAMV